MSKYFEEYEKEDIEKNINICGINYTQKILSGKWKISIIWFLKENAKRFNEIQKFLANLSQGSLTKQLRELEEDEIISRKVFPEVPPRVEYSLTQKGKKMIPILDLMEEFGKIEVEKYLKENKI